MKRFVSNKTKLTLLWWWRFIFLRFFQIFLLVFCGVFLASTIPYLYMSRINKKLLFVYLKIEKGVS